MAYKLTKEERETHICKTVIDERVIIESSILADMRLLDSLCLEYPDLYEFADGDEYGKRYYCQKKCIKFAKPRNISPEQKEKLADRLQNGKGPPKSP